MKQSEIRRLINRVRSVTANLRERNVTRTRNQIFRQPQSYEEMLQQHQDTKEFFKLISANADTIAAQIMKTINRDDNTKILFKPLTDLITKPPKTNRTEEFSNDVDGKFRIEHRLGRSNKYGLMGGEYVITGVTKTRLGLLETDFRAGAGGTPVIPEDKIYEAQRDIRKYLGNWFSDTFKVEENFTHKLIEMSGRTRAGVSTKASFTLLNKHGRTKMEDGITGYVQAEIFVERNIGWVLGAGLRSTLPNRTGR